MTFVVDINFSVFKTETSAEPGFITLAIKRPFFHLNLGPMPRDRQCGGLSVLRTMALGIYEGRIEPSMWEEDVEQREAGQSGWRN